MSSWRVFCAVEFPAEVRARFEDHIARLRKELPDAAASWSRVENIHLTLKFFGNVERDRIPAISAATTRATEHFSNFEIGVGNTGVFPRPSRPQVLWIGVNDPSRQLSALQQRLETECAAAGFPKEDRAYHPHLTIARLRKPESARRLADIHLNMTFALITVPVNELIVFRSELSNKGSRYTPISQHHLPNP
jgi:2'-5' RNA ligase